MNPLASSALSSALAAFRSDHPELAPQIAAWAPLAERRMAFEVAEASEAIAALGAAALLPVLAEASVLFVACAYHQAIATPAGLRGDVASVSVRARRAA